MGTLHMRTSTDCWFGCSGYDLPGRRTSFRRSVLSLMTNDEHHGEYPNQHDDNGVSRTLFVNVSNGSMYNQQSDQADQSAAPLLFVAGINRRPLYLIGSGCQRMSTALIFIVDGSRCKIS